ncbi:hypothetical protein HHJ78_04390 [Mobiluncus mulieris]|uniref:Phage protein, HK97 gp10 family n=1 Tax=Mobiluncus mulieris TaxID=2052 RepID=A0A7Y0U0P9_9ACTO|nr:hypothetical protein [Mobiluncus mulieris]NMW64785.1 hypothetical protein [Mobiluncus mulieris]
MATKGAPFQEIQIIGARELRKQLQEAGDDLEDMKTLHHKIGLIVAARAKRLAPKKKVSRNLNDTTRSAKTKRAAIVKVGNKRYPYANPIHWGWFTRPNPAKRWYGGKIKPRFWVSRASKETEPQWFALYEKEMNKALDKVKGIKK